MMSGNGRMDKGQKSDRVAKCKGTQAHKFTYGEREWKRVWGWSGGEEKRARGTIIKK